MEPILSYRKAPAEVFDVATRTLGELAAVPDTPGERRRTPSVAKPRCPSTAPARCPAPPAGPWDAGPPPPSPRAGGCIWVRHNEPTGVADVAPPGGRNVARS